MIAICGRVAPCGSVAAGWNSKSRPSGAGLKKRASANRNGRAKLTVRATMDGPESSTMDYQGALKFLGLTENASSEDMVRAKNQMLSRYEDQEEKLKTVSARVGGERELLEAPTN